MLENSAERAVSTAELQLLEHTIRSSLLHHVHGALLIRWHLQDLPDDTERARNDAIEALQGTRVSVLVDLLFVVLAGDVRIERRQGAGRVFAEGPYMLIEVGLE